MKLIVGLGNPGPQYEQTRHNIGFWVVDRLAARHAPDETPRARFNGLVVESRIDEEKLILLKPMTFMNRSGQSVAEAVRFFQIEPTEDLLVVVDDVALPCGTIRLRPSGGPGGHNGLTDIQSRLGTTDYGRLRIGIDPPGEIPQVDYVLGRFRPDQLEQVIPALDEAADAAECWAARGMIEAMNQYNRKKPASAGPTDPN